MDLEESTQAVEALARVSQQLNFMQMMFVIFMVSVFFMASVFLLFWRFASVNANADINQSKELLIALRENTTVVKDVLEQFKVTQVHYWRRNTREHRQTMRTYKQLFQMNKHLIRTTNHIRKSLIQIAAILESSDLLDTKEMNSIQGGTRDPPIWVDPSVSPNSKVSTKDMQ